jgi:Rieske Fe-S protein
MHDDMETQSQDDLIERPRNPNRRELLKWMTVGFGAVVALVTGFPAVAYLLDPLRRKAQKADFLAVARLSDLPRTGESQPPTPVQVPVTADQRRDAWTTHPTVVVGSVWLLRRADNSVRAFTTICPHLGCSVNHDAGEQRFVCPCHSGTFHLNGERFGEGELDRPNPAPRGMDPLEVRTVPIEGTDDHVVEVRYERFIQGLPDRVVKT